MRRLRSASVYPLSLVVLFNSLYFIETLTLYSNYATQNRDSTGAMFSKPGNGHWTLPVAKTNQKTTWRRRRNCHIHNQSSKNGDEMIEIQRTVTLSTDEMEEEASLSYEEICVENKELKDEIHRLTLENEKLKLVKANQPVKIVLEQFEGEGSTSYEGGNDITGVGSNDKFVNLRTNDDFSVEKSNSVVASSAASDMWCDELDGDSCPIEPNLSFFAALRDRAYWLVGLLAFQSCSGFILARNEALLQNHPVVVYFLTMLVGAGGNAGNQASVRVIRGLALGTLDERTQNQFLNREFKMALSLSAILSVAGFVRALAFRTPLPETIAVTTALSCIVFTSICLGALLPLLLKKLGVDPAHSSTSIQVIMDILGVLLTVAISQAVLDSSIGKTLLSTLG